MTDCWQCDEPIDGHGNYCTQCAAPLTPRSAAQSFTRSTNEFSRGLDGILDLLDGRPAMLAEGLAEMEGYDDLSAAEWQRRFENSLRWIWGYFHRLWMSHYDLTSEELQDFIDEHEDELETSEPDVGELPTPSNERCACGTSLPDDSPWILTRWKEATEVTAVCFECFGQISSRIDVAD